MGISSTDFTPLGAEIGSGSSQPSPYEETLRKLEDKSAVIGVMGLGYVGLPLAKSFIDVGLNALGFDVDSKKVDSLNSGKSYVDSPNDDSVADWIKHRKFESTLDMSRLAEADVIFICVPTPLTRSRDPDLNFVRNTARSIATELRPGQLVVLQSTTYPGTTRDVLLPILEVSGLTPSEDFFLAYSPERENPGSSEFAPAIIPRVVGGLDPLSSKLACSLYRQAVAEVIEVSTLEVAEACKILETTYRSVNIALVNELKILFDTIGIDVWEVIEAAKTKPFGFQAFSPGPGIGGHSVPVDPFCLSWLGRTKGLSTRFIELAGEVNHRMPEYIVSRTASFLNEFSKPIRGSKICVLGMAYKKDINDPRESPSFKLVELLRAAGADFTYSDPLITRLPNMRHHNLPPMESVDLSKEFLKKQDCVIIATDHTDFDYGMIVEHSQLVVDTRNATRQLQGNKLNVRFA